ncbi:MAG: DUF3352 domain-containing protein [Bacteroides sp.]|nr:DUF3352 domain-containing protein [Bacteroides sp.]
MDENQTPIPEEQPVQPIEDVSLSAGDTASTPPGKDSEEKKKNYSRFIRRGILGIAILVLLYLSYSIAHVFISPDRHIQQIYLVPEDAAFIIRSSEPVKDWRAFSESAPWQTLKQAQSFDEVAQNVGTLDSLIRSNQTLLSLVGKRDLLISLHKISSKDWDALILVDLQKVSKLETLKEQMETVLKMTGSQVTQRIHNTIPILEMRDEQTRETLYMAFIDNHLAASYTSRLVEGAIDERNNPRIGRAPAFIEAEKLVSDKGLCRLYVNYAHVPQFLAIYLGGSNEYIDMFSRSMDFAGLWFDSKQDRMEVKGYTLCKEEADPYVTALLQSGKHRMKAHEILSARTAFYTNIGFSNPATFVKELEKALAIHDEVAYNDFKSTQKKLEGYFGISLEKNFLSWMSGEFALSQSEPGLLGQEPERILAIRAGNIRDARKNMELLEKRIKNRTPIKVKKVEYKKYEINYLEMKGFFRLFFGKLFDSFEKPYYTYLGDYVIFSNTPSALLSFLEDYEQKNLLKNDPGFRKSFKQIDNSSTLFVYADMHKFFPQLQQMMDASTRADLQANRDVLYSFPYWSMQITGEKEAASLHYLMEHQPYTPELEVTATTDPDEEDETMKEDAATEKELMNELKRFYVEKFEGNVLRDFYEEGALKSESEVKNGKRNGRHREYYESGKLKVRGKYSNNRPKGTWKYYTEEGKFERKEKF